MPPYCIVDAAKALVTVKFGPHVTADDVACYLKNLRANPVFDPSFSELVDLREVMHTEVNFETAVMLSRDYDPFSETSRRAFVTSRDAIYGVVRMYQIVRNETDNIAIFPTLEAAQLWLQRSAANAP